MESIAILCFILLILCISINVLVIKGMMTDYDNITKAIHILTMEIKNIKEYNILSLQHDSYEYEHCIHMICKELNLNFKKIDIGNGFYTYKISKGEQK